MLEYLMKNEVIQDAERLLQIGPVKLGLEVGVEVGCDRMSSRGPVPDLTSNFVPELFQVPTSSKVGTQVGPQIGMSAAPYFKVGSRVGDKIEAQVGMKLEMSETTY
jgi:hypothetical protein